MVVYFHDMHVYVYTQIITTRIITTHIITTRIITTHIITTHIMTQVKSGMQHGAN